MQKVKPAQLNIVHIKSDQKEVQSSGVYQASKMPFSRHEIAIFPWLLFKVIILNDTDCFTDI